MRDREEETIRSLLDGVGMVGPLRDGSDGVSVVGPLDGSSLLDVPDRVGMVGPVRLKRKARVKTRDISMHTARGRQSTNKSDGPGRSS
jgi:hypothetical protein